VDKVSAGFGQLSAFWKGLSLGRQMTLAIFTLGALLLSLYIAFIGSRENFAVLRSA